jgi:uncharacterized protein YndB with AHSA1/START domain
MTVDELNRIERTIEINAPPDRVWRSLTNSQELGAWFKVTIEGTIAEGADVWMTSTHAQYTGQRFLVRFVEMTPPRRLVWEWHPGEVDSKIDYSREPRTTVTFTLEPSNGGTRLSVVESGFDAISLTRRANVYQDNSQGWSEVLGWLQKHVEASR